MPEWLNALTGSIGGALAGWFIALKFEKLYTNKDIALIEATKSQIHALEESIKKLESQNEKCEQRAKELSNQVFDLMAKVADLALRLSEAKGGNHAGP
jgi:hypothetical protein